MDHFSTPHREVRFDRGRHHRAKLGFVLLATEQTIQDDMMQLRPDGVGIHFSRAPIPDCISVETLHAQLESLAGAAELLLPDGSLDVVCYACTSGSVVMGDESIRAALAAGAPAATPTTLISAVVAGLHAVHARRIAMATPYVEPINRIEAEYLRRHGFEIVNVEGLGLEKDSEMVRVESSFLFELGKAVDCRSADAVFISCGALRSLEITEDLERELGKPVIVSNQAMMWHCLRLAGVDNVIEGFGRLMTL